MKWPRLTRFPYSEKDQYVSSVLPIPVMLKRVYLQMLATFILPK